MSTDKNSVLTSQALSAIHEEALKLLKKSLPPDIEQGVALIESISGYGHDIRSIKEKIP